MSRRSRTRKTPLVARAATGRAKTTPAGPQAPLMIAGRDASRSGSGSADRLQETWSRAEIALFKGIHGTHTDEDLARFFGRSLENVLELARELRLAKDKAWRKQLTGPRSTRMPRWTSAEVRQLRSQYATRANVELARELGRTVASVVSKARLMKLKKSARRLSDMGRENVSVRYVP